MAIIRKPLCLDYFNFDYSLCEKLVRGFGLKEEIAFRPILLDGATCSLIDVRSATSRKMIIYVGGKRLFLKQIPWYCSENQVSFSTSLQSAMCRAKVPVPKLIKTVTGELALFIAGSYFTLAEYMPGTRFLYKKGQAVASGRQLAELHKAGRSMQDGIIPISPESDLFTDSHEHLDLAEKLADERDDFPALTSFRILRSWLGSQKRLAYSAGWDYLAKGFVHGDYNPWNLVFGNDSVGSYCVSGILDFDNAHRGPVLRDLAEAVITFCWVNYEQDSTSFASSLCEDPQKFLAAMITAYADVRPLSSEEIDCLPAVAGAVTVEILSLGYIRGDYKSSTIAEGIHWATRVADSMKPNRWERTAKTLVNS